VQAFLSALGNYRLQCVFYAFTASLNKMPFFAVLFRKYIKTGKAAFASSNPVGHPTFF
tara:strand:- start:1953 stop:2126 length:174 start_codon:yes stop_codon:yes gene_type:complete